MPNRNRKKGKRPTAQNTVLKKIEQNTRNARDYPQPNAIDPLPIHPSNKSIYTFRKTYSSGKISISTSATTFGVIQPYLALPDSTNEIDSSFQFYRIIQITVNFIPVSPIVNSITSSNTQPMDIGRMHTVVDWHNTAPAITISELQEYKTHQVVRAGEFFSRTFHPRTLGRVYAGVTDGFYAMPNNVWLSTLYNDVYYYGLKWGLTIGTGISNGSDIYDVQVDCVIQAKHSW